MPITVTFTVCSNASQAQPTTAHIERSENGGAFVEVLATPYVETIPGRTFVDTTAVSGGTYAYQIFFSNVDGPGDPSAATPTVTLQRPKPLPPTTVKAVQS